MATQVPSTAGFITVDTSTSKTLQLPVSTQRIGRIITIKDRTGQAQTNPIVIQTQGGDTFQDAATTYRITVPFGSATFISRSGQWILQQGTQDVVVSTIKGDGSGLTNLPLAQPFQSTVAGLGTASYISSLSLTSTVRGLGSASYVSTASLISTTGGLQSFVQSSIQNQPYVYAGTTLYMNFSVDVPPYKELGNDITFSTNQLSTTTLAASSSNIFLLGFQTDFNLPSFIPKGLWNFTVFSQVSGTDVSMYPEIYIRSTTGTEYLVATNQARPNSVLTTLNEWEDDLIIPSTINLYGGQTIVVKLFANNSNAAPRNITNYFEDGTYSHVHTTFGTIFPDTVLQSTVAGLGQAGYVSTATLFSTSAGLFNYTNTFIDVPELRSTVGGLGSATYISTASLVSTTAGLQFQFQTAGFLSTANLISTVAGLGSAGYASTSFVGNAISTFSTAIGASALPPTAFTSTVAGLGSAGYVSTATLFSTTTGLFNYVSTFIDPVELASTITGLGSANFVSTIGLQTRLQSTVEGLGSASYVSTASLISTTAGIQRQFQTAGFLSTPNLLSTVAGLGSASYISTLSLVSTTTGLQNQFQTAGFMSSANLTSTVAGLGSAGYASTSFVGNAISTFSTAIGASALPPTAFTSTVAGLGSASYVSTTQLVSTTQGLQIQIQTAGFLSSLNLTSTVAGLGSAGYASTSFVGNAISTFSTAIGASALPPTAFTSTVAGLGTAGYVSSLSLISTTAGLQFQFQTAGFLSSPNLVSTVAGLGSANYVSTTTLFSTTTGLYNFVSTFIDPTELTSTITGLGSASFVSSLGLDTRLQSTVAGLGTAGYVSTATLFSTTTGLYNYVSTFIDPTELTSTIIGLGSVSFVSSIGLDTRLQSTVAGLGSASYVSTATLFSTTTGIYNFVSTFIDPTELTSTIIGLGSASFVSSIGLQARLQSTVEGLGSANYVSTATLFSTTTGLYNFVSTFVDTVELTSTITGLGSLSYVSSASLLSTTTALRREYVSSITGLGTLGYLSSINIPFLSSFTVSTGRINTSTLTFIDINTQAQQVLLVSSGTLTLNGNAIGGGGGAASGLTISDYVVAGRLNADQNLTADVDNDIQFIDDFDPQNWYNPTNYLLTPTIAGYYLVSYQVWFNTGAVSTNQYNIQIQKNAADTYAISQLVQNTVTGTTLNATKIIYMNGSTDNLRFRAYVGNTSNTSAKAQFGTNQGSGTFFTAALLTNGSGGANLVSTTVGLGSIGYVSTSQLVSTTQGLQTAFQTAGFISSLNLTSTVAGLGSAGYASTTFVGNAISTFSTAIGASALPPTAFTSTVAGLGSAGYISSSQLISTVAGLTAAPSGFPSTVSTAYGTSFTTLSLTAFQISSQQIQTSSITGNQSIFQTLSSQALVVSSFYTATRQMTPMFVVF